MRVLISIEEIDFFLDIPDFPERPMVGDFIKLDDFLPAERQDMKESDILFIQKHRFIFHSIQWAENDLGNIYIIADLEKTHG